MGDPADLVRDSCTRLAGHLPVLEHLVTQPPSPSGGAGMGPRPADAPFPGNAEAFAVLMVIWEKIPRLEASLLTAVAGHPGLRRGGSAGNWADALDAISGLAAGLPEDAEAAVRRIVDGLVHQAGRLPGIDEAQRWRPVPQRPCPSCGCYFLRVLEDARGQPGGRVKCFGHTEDGPCRAAWSRLLDLASDLDALTAPDMAG